MPLSARERALLAEALPAYEVGEEIGRGAFGIVYAGHHRQLGRHVAIKQLPRAFAADPAVRARFADEAQTVARLEHPHIVPVYDYVDRSDGICLLVMERCVASLSGRFESDGLATDEACAAVLACLAALDFAHASGVLHRDVKPENLLYDVRGTIKLGDFGIARAVDAGVRRTATGAVIGTPAYMSPEQVRGEELTPASDVYSVGVMAYELLTGALPFPRSTSSTGLLAHHLVTPPTPLLATRPELPMAIGAVIDRSLSKAIPDRQNTARELAADLTRACVASFGTGWLRERRFVLHWPDVVAESERPQGEGVRTGTIVVRAAEQRADLIGAPPAAASDGFLVDDAPAVGVATQLPVGQAPGGAAGSPTLAPTGVPPVAPSAADPGASVPAGPGGGSRRWLAAAVVAAVVALVAVVLLTRGGDTDETVAGAESSDEDTGDEEVSDATDEEAGDEPSDGETSDDASDEEATTTTEFDLSEVSVIPPIEPAADPIVVDSPWAASPCPDPADAALRACVIGVSIDEEAQGVTVLFAVDGFVPDVDGGPHLHVYLDTAIAGDERRAGSEQRGGTWREWGNQWPMEAAADGAVGFTVADVQQSGARFVCTIVADEEHRAIPGSGNCAPIPHTWDTTVAAEQVDRLTGIYAGRCAIGVSLILPEAWRWVDLVATPVDEAARILRPSEIEQATPILEQLVSQGGVLWADGEVDSGYLVNLNVVRIQGGFSASDDPDRVAEVLAQSALTFEGEVSERTLAGRPVLVHVVSFDGYDLTQYVIPDHDYAIVLNVNTPDADAWAERADAIAATVLGC